MTCRQDGRRVHRLCEGQAGEGEHGLIGQRHLGASVRRNVHDDVGHQDAARALPGRGACDHRYARRPGPGDLRQYALDHPAYPRRFLAGAGGDLDGAGAAIARRSDGGRHRSGLRGERTVRDGCTEEDAGGGHREAQQGDQRGARGTRDQGQADRPRRRTADRAARRLRQDDRRRNRNMGEGGQGRRRSRGLNGCRNLLEPVYRESQTPHPDRIADAIRPLPQGERSHRACGPSVLDPESESQHNRARRCLHNWRTPMAYVDGFIVAGPKKNLAGYRRMAKKAGKFWREHGALDYREWVADDVKVGKRTSFPRSVKLKPGETVVFSWITYKSRAQRDRVNARVMADKRLTGMMDTKSLPFDAKRMIYGGFESLVKA